MPHPLSRLLAQLAADCTFLEDIRVMDYSLLMGVHSRGRGETSASAFNTDKVQIIWGVWCRVGPEDGAR